MTTAGALTGTGVATASLAATGASSSTSRDDEGHGVNVQPPSIQTDAATILIAHAPRTDGNRSVRIVRLAGQPRMADVPRRRPAATPHD